MVFRNLFKPIKYRFIYWCTVQKCHQTSIFLIITCKFLSKRASQQIKMDKNEKCTDTNHTNSAIATGVSLSHHNGCIPGDAGCSGIPNVHDGTGAHRHRQESNILNVSHLYANFYANANFYACNLIPPHFYYANCLNYNNVSFNSSEGTVDLQNNRKIIKHQQETIEKYRKWLPVAMETPENGTYFTVLNYNVLAQDLVQENSYLYKNHSARACLWETRWNNLYREITSYNADIICLQEVQQSHLRNYYRKLENIGYVGIFKKRTGMRPDGCAIYYKKTLFKIVENTTIEFNQATASLDRENVGIIARFALKQHPNVEFVVATTHLLYNPKRMDVRLAQTQLLLTEIERIAYDKTRVDKSDQYVPIILTGDFNSKPDSAVYKLIVDGRLYYEYLSNRTLAPIAPNSTVSMNGKLLISPHLKVTDNCQHYEIVKARAQRLNLTRNEEISLINLRHSKRKQPIAQDFSGDLRFFSTGTLTHPLNLLSAFKHFDNDDFEATTHQNEWITVDYIFYSGKSNKTEDKLKLISNYRIPTTRELKEIKYIPNFVIGSDHLPLLSKFKLIH